LSRGEGEQGSTGCCSDSRLIDESTYYELIDESTYYELIDESTYYDWTRRAGECILFLFWVPLFLGSRVLEDLDSGRKF